MSSRDIGVATAGIFLRTEKEQFLQAWAGKEIKRFFALNAKKRKEENS